MSHGEERGEEAKRVYAERDPNKGPSIEDRIREAHRPVDLFEIRLRQLINELSIDSYAETPDYLLARYLRDCLDSYVTISHWTKQWRE